MKSVRSGVERRRGRGSKARGGRRDAPEKVLKDRRSPRRRGRMGTSVSNAPGRTSAIFRRAPRAVGTAAASSRASPRSPGGRSARRRAGASRTARASRSSRTRSRPSGRPSGPIPGDKWGGGRREEGLNYLSEELYFSTNALGPLLSRTTTDATPTRRERERDRTAPHLVSKYPRVRLERALLDPVPHERPAERVLVVPGVRVAVANHRWWCPSSVPLLI